MPVGFIELRLFNMIDSGKGGKEKLNRARILLKADIGVNGEGWKDSAAFAPEAEGDQFHQL